MEELSTKRGVHDLSELIVQTIQECVGTKGCTVREIFQLLNNKCSTTTDNYASGELIRKINWCCKTLVSKKKLFKHGCKYRVRFGCSTAQSVTTGEIDRATGFVENVCNLCQKNLNGCGPSENVYAHKLIIGKFGCDNHGLNSRPWLSRPRNRRAQLNFLVDGMTRYFQSDDGKRLREKQEKEKLLNESSSDVKEKNAPNACVQNINAQSVQNDKVSSCLTPVCVAVTKKKVKAVHDKERNCTQKKKRMKRESDVNCLEPSFSVGDDVEVSVTSNDTAQTVHVRSVSEPVLFPHVTDEDVHWFIMAQSIARQRKEERTLGQGKEQRPRLSPLLCPTQSTFL